MSKAVETIDSWRGITSTGEARPAVPLLGWRVCVLLTDGQVLPFGKTSTARAVCALDRYGAGYARRHTGELVHPRCTCGLTMVETAEMCLRLWATRGHSDRRELARQVGGRYAGQVLARVATTPSSHVTGPTIRPDLRIADPFGVARTNHLRLREIHLPASTRWTTAALLERRYTRLNISVHRLPGDLTTITQNPIENEETTR